MNTIKEYLENRRLLCFGGLQRMEESSWASKFRIFEVGSSLTRRQPSKTWSEVTGKDRQKQNVRKLLAKDWNAWKAYIKPVNSCIFGKLTLN